MHIEIAQVFTQIVSFLIVLWVLKRFAWKPFLKILDDREVKIRSLFNSIEEQKKVNEQLFKTYQKKLDQAGKEVRDLIKEGRAAGIQVAREIEDKAHEEAKRIVTKTKEELQKEVEKAKVELKDEIIQIALTATEKMIKFDMDQEKQKALITDFVAKGGLN